MNVSERYLTILILLLLSIIFAIIPLISSYIIIKFINKTNFKQKKLIIVGKNHQLSAYECGVEPFSDSRLKVPIKFAVIAILFIVFYVEILFLIPCSVIWYRLTFETKCILGFFITTLTVGWVYEWKSGALD